MGRYLRKPAPKVLKSKCMVNVTSAYSKIGVVNIWANKAFAIFATYLLLGIYIFATCLQGAKLCKSIFFSSRELPTVSLFLGEELMLLRLPCLYHTG